MIAPDTARRLGAHLASVHGYTLAESRSPAVHVARIGLEALATLLPAARPVVDLLALDTVSRTVPTPWGTLVVLSDAASAEPVEYAETVAHEATHAHQIAALGGWQAAVDYLLSAELRATREAHAYVVGAWVRYLLTGRLASADEACSALAGDLYRLGADEIALARGIVASGLASVQAGSVPPYAVARDVLDWLQREAPDAIVPAGWRP